MKTTLEESDKWDNRELGASEEHVAVASEEEHAALKKVVDKMRNEELS